MLSWRNRSNAQLSGGSAVDLPCADPQRFARADIIVGHSPIQEAKAEALRNFVKIGTNPSKQSSGDADLDTRDSNEIEAEERFSSDRRTLSADRRFGWVFGSLVSRGASKDRRIS